MKFIEKIKTKVMETLIKLQPKTWGDFIQLLTVIVGGTFAVYQFSPQLAEYIQPLVDHFVSDDE